MASHHPYILRPDTALLVVVDMQEPFLRAMNNRDGLLANVRLLLQSAALLHIPCIATTQNAVRLGGIAPEIAAVLSPDSAPPIDKMTFSCAGSEAFLTSVAHSGRRQIVLCGVETHICVAQTALDLVNQGYQVHVAADAVSSRTLEKHKLGMERLRDSHVLPCAAEAAVYELLGTADAAIFKQILSLVK